ncbi:putative translational regulatory protein ArgL [Enterobacter bugandensis]
MNNYTYKVNFNSTSGVRHVRIKCLVCTRNTF